MASYVRGGHLPVLGGSRARDFLEMCPAAMLQAGQSAKVQRLIEIVHEAEENERRVIGSPTSGRCSTWLLVRCRSLCSAP